MNYAYSFLRNINEKGLFISFLLITSYLNAVLKTSVDGNMTLFRLLLPLIIIVMISERKRKMTLFIIFAFFLILYAYIISFLPFNRFSHFDIVFTLHYILVPYCFLLIKYFIDKLGIEYLYVFFKRMYILMIILAFIQLFFGGIYPNTQNRLPEINIFFWNENEFSAVLAIFIPLYFLKEKQSVLKYFWMLSGIFFIVYNEANILMVGIVLFWGAYFLSKIKLYRYKLLWILFIIFTLSLFFHLTSNLKMIQEYTISEFLLDPIKRIITLTPYEGVGSLISRTNAYIWGLIELKKTYFIGIGSGNSIPLMLENVPAGFERWAPKSFHNIILQMIVELGIVGIMLFVLLIRLIIDTVKKTPYNKMIVAIFFIVSILFTTILSGAFSNYPFIFIFGYALHAFKSTRFLRNRDLFEK